MSAVKRFKGDEQGIPGEYRTRGPRLVQLALRVATLLFLLPPTPPHQMV